MTEFAPSRSDRPLGDTSILLSPMAWGMWRFGSQTEAEGRTLIETALEAGITVFDTADIYGLIARSGLGGAEDLLGRILASSPRLREQMVIATKGGITPPAAYDSSNAYLTGAVDASLRRLQIQQIDLYQIHRPDLLTHPQEAARALEDMVISGKVRSIGVSNYTAAQTTALARFLPIPIATQQPEFSPLALSPISDGLLDHAMEHGMAVLAWSPLAGGRLLDPQTTEARAAAALLDQQADRFGVSRAAATYSWVMLHPSRPIPIVGTQNPSRIAEAPDAFKVTWTRREWYAVHAAGSGHPIR